MRRVPVPNSNAASEFGVELDKTLADGSRAIGLVQITDTPSPYKADEILLRINAWQVHPDGRPIAETDEAGRTTRRAIREMIVSVPRSEFTTAIAEEQIDIAAAALAKKADEIPEPPAPLPPVPEPAADAPVFTPEPPTPEVVAQANPPISHRKPKR